MSAATPLPADSAPPPPPPRRRRHWLRAILVVVLLLVLAIAGAIAWLFTTSSGAQFALGRAVRAAGEGVTLQGVEGAIGGVLRIRRIEVKRPGLYALVEDFEMDTQPLSPLRGTLVVNRLTARAVEVRTASTEEAAKVPVSFAPPYPIRLDEGRVGELRKGTLDGPRDKDLVLRDLYLKGGGDRREWRIAEMSGQSPYGNARIEGRLETAAPFALDFKAALEGVAAEKAYRATLATRGTLKALTADVDAVIAGQKATARAALEPFNAMPVRSLEVKATQLDASAVAAGAPRTRLDVEAKLIAQPSSSFAGPVRIVNAEPGPWDQEKLPFVSAAASVVLTQEQVDVGGLDVALPGGGSVAGEAKLQRSGVQANLRVANVDLSALHRELQKTRVTGRIAASGDTAAQRFEVALQDPRFAVEGRGGLAQQRLDLETVTIRTGGGAVTAKGGLALAGRRDFRFEGRAEHFDPSAFVKTTRGDLNFTFVASGAMADGIAGELHANVGPSTYAGLPASGRVNVAGDKRRIASADVELAMGEARIAARGSFGRRGNAMDISFRVPNLSAIAKPLGVAIAGRAEGEGRLTGTFDAPAGRLSLTAANLVLPSNVYIRELAVRGEAGVDPASRIEARVQAKGLATGQETPPTTVAESLDATLTGTRAEHRLEIDSALNRETRVRAAFAGGLDPRSRDPAWNGRLESLAMTGRGAFALQAPAPLFLSAARIELGDAQLKGDWGEARFEQTRWTPRTLDFKGSSPALQVQQLARSFRLGTVPRSNLVLAVDWNVHAAESFDGTLTMRRVSGDLRVGEPVLPLGLRELVVDARVVRGRAQASVRIDGERTGRVQGEGTGLIVRGKTGWELAADQPVRAHLVAEHGNLEALSPWLGPDGKLGGRLDADVTVTGTGADPRVAGVVRAQDLVAREPLSGFEVEQGQVALRLDGQRLAIERFTAVTPWRPVAAARASFEGMALPPHGTISAEGSVDIGARTGSLRVRADKTVVTQTSGRFLALSGEARLASEGSSLAATGNFTADAGWVGALDTPPPSISEDVVVVRGTQAPPPPAEEAPKGGEGIRVDLRLGLGEHTYFEGRGLDTRLAGEVRITGTPGAALQARGTIRTVGGTYKGYGQNLAIERGVLQFSGPLDNPQLNVLAVRKGLAVEPGVEVLGTVSRPRIRLVSTPDVPEPDKLSWLVLGRGPSELAPGDASVLLAAASSMLGSNNPGSDLGKKFGIDEVKIGRADTNSILGVLPQSTVAGKTGSASAAEVVSVGKKLGRNFHLTYEQGLADAEGALKVTWTLTQKFQVLVRAGFLPGLDAVYRWTFQ